MDLTFRRTTGKAALFRGRQSEYAIHQKGFVLDFRMHLLPLLRKLPSGHSVHDPSGLCTFGFAQPAHRSVIRYSCGRHLWSGLVDHLEGSHLGKRMGRCRERYTYPDFPTAIHYPLTTRLGSPRGGANYRNSRTGYFYVAR